ncbi:arylsulfatase [bacterium]|nr:arylsulfatase [bacterium]MDC0497358.1 arylsulfatase [bacterium]
MTKNNTLSLVIASVILSLSAACSAANKATAEKPSVVSQSKPNVILIYADDLGIGLLGCYGQEIISTPYIDRLAAEGMKFNNYYGGVLCAPARWSLLTGMHDGRQGGWGQNAASLLIKLDKEKVPEQEYSERFNAYVEKSSIPIPEDEVFLGQVAQQAGYKTAQFGKLDVGFLTNHKRVERFGWDHYIGYYSHQRAHGFYPPYLWQDGEKLPLEGNTDPYCGKMSEKGNEPVGSGGETYSQNVFIDGMLEFIREHKDEPFFLYHSTQLPHGPVAIPELHPDFADHPTFSLAEKKYASMVKMLDDHVGLIMQELKAQGLDDNTIVLFTSDNGHELYYGPKWSMFKKLANGDKANLTDKKWRSSNGGDVFNGSNHLAGAKRAAYQGGMVCPMIVRWPGKIEPGTENSLLSSHFDFMATMGDVIGAEVPEGKDSISYLPTLLAQPQVESQDYIIINNRFDRMGRTAMIGKDGWKLVEVDREEDHFQLYNIKEDFEERHNLEAKYPERVAALKKILLSELESPRPDLASSTKK